MSGLAAGSGRGSYLLRPPPDVDPQAMAQALDWMAAVGGRLVWDGYLISCYVEIGEGRTRRTGPWKRGRWAAIAAAMVCIASEDAQLRMLEERQES
jgi:hypothetical protein